MSDAETPTKATLSKEQAIEEAKEPPKTPAPTATGNEKITILKRHLLEEDMYVVVVRVQLALSLQ